MLFLELKLTYKRRKKLQEKHAKISISYKAILDKIYKICPIKIFLRPA